MTSDDEGSEQPPGGVPRQPPPRGGRSWRRRGPEEHRAERLLRAQQWAAALAAQRARHLAELEAQRIRPMVAAGPSNFSRGQVPYGVDLAAAWSWRLLVILGAIWVVVWGMGHLAVVLIPVVIALFVAALVAPAVSAMTRVMPRGLATLGVVVALLGVVSLMLTFATQQIVQGAEDLSDQVVQGLDQVRNWLQNGPLHATDKQIDGSVQDMQDVVVSSSQQLVERLQQIGSTISTVVAGFFLVLFATYFFLADGSRIWLWVVRLFPRAARERADASGRVAWLSLTQFVRATVLVAAVDALGIMGVAALLNVPLVAAIGLLVFLSSFVPLVGALVSGLVAVLVALVAQGPVAAALMVLGVVVVQQIEAQVLQPFLLGRMVSIHPLAVLLAVASGVILAGIAGALIAVPLVACINSVVVYLTTELPPSVTEGSHVNDQGEIDDDPAL